MPDNDQGAWFTIFALFIIFAGIDTSMAMMESFVTNVIDASKRPRITVVIGVGVAGILISLPFSTNFGWVLFDLVDHYIRSYVTNVIGILQCVAIGWQFEQESTQRRSV